MFLTKLKSGHYAPVDSESIDQSNKIKVGAEVKATIARNVQFHRKGFALLNIGFENQDKYATLEIYRKILTIRCGYYDEFEGKDGLHYYFPQSLSFDKMSAETFEKWYNITIDIISNDMSSSPDLIRKEVEKFY